MTTDKLDTFSESSSMLPDLQVSLLARRSFFRKEWVGVKIYAFSPKTLVIKTDEDHAVGDVLTLTLKLPQTFEIITVESLGCAIKSKHKMCSNFFYLLDISAPSDVSARKKIERIDDLIQKKIALNQRRNSTLLSDVRK
jgi:hypothetical protein